MYYVFAFIAVVVVVVVVVGLATGRLGSTLRRSRERQEHLESARTPTLEYVVPTGQDPAVVLTALRQAGFVAATDSTTSGQRVLIECPEGVERQRARARSAIESANVTTHEEGAPVRVDVQFTDEA
jgi:hypothetical protein